jgi:PAS domain S-box-containing protein
MNDIAHVAGYKLTEPLYAGPRTWVYRAVRSRDAAPVVIKLLRNSFPSFNELVQFRNQYAIAKNIDLPGVVKMLALEPCGQSYALVMEDFGGISLKSQLEQAGNFGNSLPSLTTFLQIAIQIAAALDGLHRQRVIHKDLKPANILVHPETHQVKLIDFSIASLLPRETPTIQTATALEGTLAYLSPEQTGRMNRDIDYRSDFYSLGITFYELLTGQLPHRTDDPMELVHAHLAKRPVAAHRVNAGIPVIVSALIGKLMAKNAEDRYQTAVGLKHDLDFCLRQLTATGAIAEFALGQRDLSDRFLIPEKLYGREAQVQSLLATFDRVAEGESALLLVAGASGIGKTAVVNEVHQPIVRQRGYFIKGKFDQFNRSIPLSAFVQALRDLMGQLLAESDAQLAQWQAQILAAVGENGQVLIEVIPELEQIIGKPAIAPELAGSAVQNRFNLLFQNFIGVFTTAQHPLVLFLDDLQWADLASLQLIQLLMSDTDHLLILGAYRNNEVSPAHPLLLTVAALKKAQASVQTITLEPLAFDDTNHLIADTLNCSRALAQPLTELVDRKTQGNPFFTTQFLKALYEDGQISFDCDRGYWECDIAQVNTLTITDDVVEFMAWQLQKLPTETQQALQLAACIGNQFDLVTLAIVSEQSLAEAATALWHALKEGLILPTSQVYKFFQSQESEPSNIQQTANPTYRFLHDRVQQAAYSLIPKAHRATLHYRIGRLLLSHFSSAIQEERIFEIVGHLNPGNSLILDPTERIDLARWNLMAGRKAKAATAYGAAVAYLTTGISLLPPKTWELHYDFTLELHTEVAEAAYLNTDFEPMEQWATVVLQHAKTLLDTIQVQRTRLMGAKAQGQLLDAIQIGLQVLQSLGIEFPDQPAPGDIEQALATTHPLWAGRSPLSLLDLPAMTDPKRLAAMEILSWLVPCAYWANPTLMALLILKQVEFSIQYGNCPTSIYGYADYGLILCGVIGEIASGYDFGQLALRLLDQLQMPAFKCRAWYVVYTYIQHWQVPLPDSVPQLQEAYQSGLETGDLECAGLNAAAYCCYAYHSGQELTGLATTIQAYRQTICRLKQRTSQHYLDIYQQTILNLLGYAEAPDQLAGTIFNAAEAEGQLQAASHRTALFYLYFNQTVLSYLFGHYSRAAQQSILTEQHLDGGIGTFMVPLYAVYDSLVQLARYGDAPEPQQRQILERVAKHQDKLQGWATLAPFNHQHSWELVEAERCAVLGDRLAAIEHYDRAIAGANANGYIPAEALANELTAKFYLKWGKEKVAAAYMQEAYYGYAHWGAKAKIQDLERRYAQLLTPILQPQRTALSTTETLFALGTLTPFQDPATPLLSTGNTSMTATLDLIPATLDLVTVLKASQTLSSEIQLDKLLATLLHTVLENAGADKGALLMPREQQWFVEAIATLDQPARVQAIALDNSPDVPQSLINIVKHSRQAVVIADAAAHPTLATDPYLVRQPPKSLLCTPMLRQGKLVAILYLENQVTVGAFTRDRLQLVNVLCTQAAISLENARLYQQSQTTLQELQQSRQLLKDIIDNIPQLVFWKAPNSSFLGCNTTAAEVLNLESPEQIIGKTDYDFSFTPQEIEWYHQCDRRIMESGQAEFHIIETQQRSDGSQSWLDTSKIPLRDSTSNIIGILIMVTDITDRKATEAAAKAFQERLTFLIQETPIGIIEWNTEFQVVQWNPSAERIFGYQATEMLNQHATEIVPESDRAHVAEVMTSLIGQQGGFYSVNQNIRNDGTRITCEWINTPLRDAEGNSTGIFSIVQDISDRIAAEAAIQQKSQELEQALQELQNAQLQMVQTEKMASLGTLVAGIAHEINNPLGFLKGSIKNAQDYGQDLLDHLALYQQHHLPPAAPVQDHATDIELEFLCEDLPKLLHSMQGATDRIQSISTSLRIFSRVDTGHKVSANLHPGIDSTLLILKYRLKANERRPAIQVIQDYGDLPPIQCFPEQLNQVFMNVLANAIDVFDEATQHASFADLQANPQKITIQTALTAQNAVEIRIRDNGKGMSEAIKARIFDHLFTTKGVGRGTGLGLAIARQIVVEKHAGSLEVKSILGQGAEFIVTIPV